MEMDRDDNLPLLDIKYRRPINSLGHKVYLNHPHPILCEQWITLPPCQQTSLHDDQRKKIQPEVKMLSHQSTCEDY
jgi:hypothetical protein